MYLYTGSDDNTLKLWDIKSGSLIKSFKTDGPVLFVSGECSKILIASTQNKAHMYSYKYDFYKSYQLNYVKFIQVSSNGDYYIISKLNGDIEVYDIKLRRKHLLRNKVEGNVLIHISYSFFDYYTQNLIIVASYSDKTVKIYDIVNNYISKTYYYEYQINATSIYNNYVSTASTNGTIYLYYLSGEFIRSWNSHPNNSITALTMSKNYIASGSDTGLVQIHDVDSETCLKSFWEKKPITSLSFSPDSKLLVVSTTDSKVYIYSVNEGKKIRMFIGHTGKVNTVSVNYCQAGFSNNQKYNILEDINGTFTINQ